MKFKKGDNVIVIAGKEKGNSGKITKVLRAENKVLLEGMNIRKKHQKAGGQNKTGQILELPTPIDASNVMIADGKDRSRIGYKMVSDKKVRIAKKSGNEIK